MDDDRISDSPDPIIHKILSHLNMKYVVQTSILSNRWRHLCASATNSIRLIG
ncbi:hypothetical protein GIB67_025166 [Kingdonia uniflora]|uniref:F-box domain-containing protein n=1 Tax=Kingdonia uniflora TaxID=39325 RepID=A0A7J7N8D9_9MAGN|nr:hypothetical protein GIB67_025166 [Kingdonia uniflora]